MNRIQLAAIYLDYLNNYISLSAFADAFGLYEDEAKALLQLCKKCHYHISPDE